MGRRVLHKLSSRSACTAWPTVHRDEWNVGQTPPPLSFFLCLYPSLSAALTNTTAVLSTFGKQEEVCGAVLSFKIHKLQQIKTAVWLVI